MDFVSYYKRNKCVTRIGDVTLFYWIGPLGWTAHITPNGGTSPIGKMWIDEKLDVHFEGGIAEFPEGEVFLRGLEATWRSH